MKNGSAWSMMLVLIAAWACPALADEGMWLMNQLPAEQIKAKYGFAPTAEWAEHIRSSCIRFGRGGSASFVSPHGLVMTNHHVGSGAIQDVSDADHNYMRDGFYARTQAEELKCPGLQLSVLMAIEDVSDKVEAAVPKGATPAEALEARKAAIAEIQAEAKTRTGFDPEMVPLFGGARHHLYLYKRYTDVRLVMAPEQGIAFFGGDISNFGYPRYCLDISFFRVYENDKPLATEHHLKFSTKGVKEGDLVFMAGHPARTERLYTVDHLKFLRDARTPLILEGLNQREVSLLQFMSQSKEHHRIGNEDLLGVQNSRKAYDGRFAGLLNARIMQAKADKEAEMRKFVLGDLKLMADYGSAWTDLEKALTASRSWFADYYLLEARASSMGALYSTARRVVRVADEQLKPDAQRLEGYHEAQLDTLKVALFSEAPIHDELEIHRLEASLTAMSRILGGDHPGVRAALGSSTPGERAAELVAGCRLEDVNYRKELFDGGKSSVAASDDAMIRFVLTMDPLARQARERYENEYESVEEEAYARIGKATFAKYGETVYPDATGSLRLSLGTVAGYTEAGKAIPANTTMGDAFALHEQHDGREPFNLPARWLEHKAKIKADTPFNFVTTNDIIGGNSGSPAFNREGELIGIVFDGNIQGLVWDFFFDQEQARAISVDARAIIEALRNVFDAGPLADELVGKSG